MMNNYNSLGYRTGSSLLNSQEPEVVGNAPNSSGKLRTSWLMSLFMMVMLLSGMNSNAQVSYSQTWAATGLNSWTTSGSVFSRTTANICATTGSIRGERYFGNSGQFISPSLGTSNGGLITMTYQYKVVDWSAGTVATSAANVGTITVEYGSTSTGPWTVAQTINSSNHIASNVCATKTATFTPSTGALYVRFNVTSSASNDSYYYFDEVAVSQGAAPTCFVPTALVVSSVTSSSASLGWTAPTSGTTPANYEYEVRTSGAAGSGATGLAFSGSPTTNSAALTGLSPQTAYSVYVRSFCGGSDFSSWTAASTFTTPCASISSFPFTETFDTTSTSVACWTTSAGSGATYQWALGTADATHGAGAPAASTRFAFLNAYNASTTYNTYNFISPSFVLDATAKRLKYSYWLGNTGYKGTTGATGADPYPLSIQISVNGGAYTSIYNHTSSNSTFGTASTSAWNNNTIDLSAYVGQTIQLKFVSNSNFGSGFCNQGLDQVIVENLPSCFESTGLLVSSVTNNSASLAWSAPTSGTTPIGYEYEVRTSGAAGSGATGLAFSGNPTSNSAALTGLTANTAYSVYVRTQCGASEYSGWTVATNFTTLCDAITTFPYTQNFDGVTAPALPSCWTQNNANADGDSWITYTGYSNSGTTSAGLYTDFNSGANNDYLILPTITLTGNQRLVYYVRARSTGEPNDYTVKLSTAGVAPASFTTTLLPLTTVSSITYTKVTIDLSAYSGNVNIAFHVPSGGLDGYYLYIDDVTVENLPTCFESTGLAVSAVTYNSASLAWSAPTGGTTPVGYEYEVRTSGAAGSGATGLAFSGTPTTNAAALTGLSATTSYSVYVRTFCGGSDYSVWTAAANFITPCAPISSLPWNEGFEGLASVSSTTFPSCWLEGTGTNWASLQTSTSSYNDPRSGTKYIGCNYSGTNDRIWTPGFQMVLGKSYEFTTYFVGDGYASWVGDVVTNTTASATGETVLGSSFITSTTTSLSGTNYTKVTRVFIPSASGVYYFGVRVSSSFAPYSYLGFDDFSVTELPDCSGAPDNGVAVIPSTSGCYGSALTLSATGLTTGSGISYQWQSSPDDSNWTDISGANAATYNLTTVSGLTYYRVNTTCTPSSTTSNSSSVSYTGSICTFDTTRTTGVTFSSIMPANGGSGLAFPGWQGTTGDDNVSTTQTLTGTTFKYQGEVVTGMQACSNGWMTFNTANTSSAYDNNLTGTTPIKVLAPFWDDFVFTAQSYANRDNSVRYKVDGTLGSGSAVITVEWAGIERYNIPGPNLNFQVKLYESDNHIEYIYGTFEGFDGSVTSAYSYSIGMNGSNPAGTSTIDHFVLQTPNENHFGVTNNTNQIIMPTCNTMYSFVPGVYSGLTSAPVAAAPANDSSAGATSLTVLSAPATSYCGTYYNSRNATDSGAGLPTCLTTALTAGDQDDDVWFKFTTSLATDYVVKLRNAPGYDGVIELLDASLTSISCQNSTGAGLIETINANGLTAGGTTYYLRVFHKGTGVGTSNGEFSLSVSEVIAPPTNDNIAGATSLSITTNCTTTSSQYPATLSATASPEAVTCSTPDDDVWYSFVATTTSNLITVQSGAGYNAALQVYSSSDNTATGTLTSLTCTNATGTAGVESYSGPYTIGNTYFVRVYHALAGVGSGNFTICVTSPAPACATLSAPANAATNVSITPTLTWAAATFATKYDVYFKETSAATYTLLAGDVITTSYAVTVPLLTSTQYSWYVIPKKADNDTACTTPTERTFTTECPLLVLSSSAASYCVGGSTTTPVTITTGTSTYSSFVWAPTTGVVGDSTSGYTFNPTATTVYTLTADNGAGCTKTATFTVTVNAIPVVNLSSTAITKCLEDSAVAITALPSTSVTGGCLTASNGLFPSTTSVATTCDGVAVTSIATNAYAGEYSNVDVLENYKYVFTSTGTGDYVTISDDAGTIILAAGPSPLTWVSTSDTTVRFYTHTNNSCGEASVNRTRSYTCQAYAGSEWTPQTGLFTDAAATTPYTGGSLVTVYAKPTTTSVYTASLTSDGCTGSSDVTVTVKSSVGGSVSGSATVCYNFTSPLLTLSGHTGSIVRWEKAVSPFTTWTPIANTTTTYTSGILTATTQFRAVVQDGSCVVAYSDPATVTVDNGCAALFSSISVSSNFPTVTPGKYLYAIGITLPSGSSITNYEYEVTNLTSNMVGTYQTTNNYFRLLDVSGVSQYYATYAVRVRLQVNGVWQPFGIAKNVNTNVLSSVAMSGTYCGTTLPTITKTIGCTLVPIATSYIFEVTDVETSAVSTYTSSTNLFSLINLATDSFPIKFNHQYSVRVQYTALVDGETITSAFSSACTITTPVGDPVPTIISPACNSVVSYAASLVRCTYVASASEYRFDLASASASHSLSGRTVNNFSFSLIDGYVTGTLYSVTPWVKLYGVWYEGTPCNLTSPGTAPIIESKGQSVSTLQVSSEFAVKAYPNPFAENFKLNVTSSIEGALQVKVYDMLGKLVEAKELSLSDIETLEVGNNYPSGVYNVVVSQGEKTQSLRVIKR